MPAGQPAHEAAPVALWKVPAPHTLQELDPEEEYEPAAQDWHSADEVEPAAATYVPAVQLAQVKPLEYWPAGHETWQAEAPAEENVPETHAEHAVAPAVAPNVLGLHAVQPLEPPLLKVPTSQRPEATANPAEAQKLPARQTAQLAAPDAGW